MLEVCNPIYTLHFSFSRTLYNEYLNRVKIAELVLRQAPEPRKVSF
jgi:hypothetical protein